MAYPRSPVFIALCAALACGDEKPTQSGTETDGSSGEPGSTGDPSGSSGEPGSTGDDPTGGDDWTVICDGSDGLRLAMALGGGGLIENELERALGFKYLYVLGTCEYYVLPSIEGVRWPDARTGVIDKATEEALSRAIDYGGLAGIAGSWGTDNVSDGSTLLVSDGAVTVACYAACEQGPAAAQALWIEQKVWTDKLWEQGEPLLGALRISVVGSPGAAMEPAFDPEPWPLAAEPWSLAAEESVDTNYPTVRIDSGDDLETLRELRQKYREDDEPPANSLYMHGHLQFHDMAGVDLFRVWIRDSLPIEDDDGRVALPSP
jgi:hypothetical protein